MMSDDEPRQMPDVNTLIAAAWPEWLKQRIQGYRQVTDATLLGTAPQRWPQYGTTAVYS